MVVSLQFKLYLPGQGYFLQSPLKPSEEKFKEQLTKDAKVTGDEETFNEQEKKAKQAESKMSKAFFAHDTQAKPVNS